MTRLFYPSDDKLFETNEILKDDLECYHKKMRFFVQSESEFFKNLYCMLNMPKLSHFVIFSKVRLGDLVNCYDKNYKIDRNAWNKISKTHIDFLICDANKDFEPILAIELDGYDHNQEKYYDKLKNQIFAKIKMPLVRIPNFANENLIRTKLSNHLYLPGHFYSTYKNLSKKAIS